MERCVKCGNSEIIGVEYPHGTPERYDGISEYLCPSCGYRQGRWTGEQLKKGQVESRHGERGVVPTWGKPY